jgi:hypothetical protein
MKTITTLLFLCGFAISSPAEETATNAAPAPQIAATISLSGGTITAPLVLTNGILSQPETTELSDGGKASIPFAVTNEADYVLVALVNAADEASNSFFLNVDADPKDPDMIWDMEVTTGFEERTVSWRGNGDANSDEISPKKFHLTAGAHKLIIVGREPAQLKSISIRPAAK